MSGNDVSTDTAAESATVGAVDMKLEVVTVPVSDVERAKRFYQGLGWRLDADLARGENFRVVQLTPPHSECSISLSKGLDAVFGTGAMEPGSQKRMELVVSDIEAAREDLVSRGVEVSQLFHIDGGRVEGPDPDRSSYMTYASFSDPDGNTWLLQEVTSRGPGRVWET